MNRPVSASALGVPEDSVRDLDSVTAQLTRLIDTSPELRRRFAELYALGASPFSALFDRQNVGSIGSHLLLDRPARHEFRGPAGEQLSVLNLATSGYLDLGS